MTTILGINAYHGDASAAIVVDGVLVAAAEEERFRRIKHWAGFPTLAIEFCLKEAGINIKELNHIAINRNPKAHFWNKVSYSLINRPSLTSIIDRLKNRSKVSGVMDELAAHFDVPAGSIKAERHNIEHHYAHLASTFLVSPFNEAVTFSVDGFGDFLSTMWGVGSGTAINSRAKVMFPHSMGLFYLAITQHLGFMHYGDEYKVMGLAPYGKPSLIDKMREIIKPTADGLFELSLDYFIHHTKGVAMEWQNGEPKTGRVYSDKLSKLLGEPRGKNEELTEHHKDIAASAQAVYEELFFHMLNHAQKKTGLENLCLAGGCAYNSVANGKIYNNTKFKKIYIQSASGDAGGAIGAAMVVWNQKLNNPRSYEMSHSYFGPSYSNSQIGFLLGGKSKELSAAGCVVTEVEEEVELCKKTVAKIIDGGIIGWFQGRMEWGPRSLGNRSILADPRRNDVREILNLKIKRRESFRPFAPSILRDAVPDWFETVDDVPFMMQVYQIKKEKQAEIPAVTHVNGSGRLQTVTEQQNPRYYHLIQEFYRQTGVPTLVNTSFNENEPVVNTPEEALNCFLRTKMDMLVLGNWVIERK